MMLSRKYVDLLLVVFLLVLALSASLYYLYKSNSKIEIKQLKSSNDSLRAIIQHNENKAKKLTYNIDSIKGTLTPDTVYKNINIRYNEKVDSIITLDDSSQVMFLSKWLSEDSI